MLQKAGLWRGSKMVLRFQFGNLHSLVEKPKNSRSNPTVKNSHRWVMYVAFTLNRELTGKFIKSVTFHLHPTFKPSVITVSEQPFILSRVGWGYFTIYMDVVFQEWTGLAKTRVEHELCFDDNGKSAHLDIDIDGELVHKHLGDNIVKQMEKLSL